MASILVVDDESAVRKLLKVVLSEVGHEVQTAVGAQEALLLCRSFECFDVVLSDVMMPGMDGHQLAFQIAELCPGSRVILMSGFDPGCEECPYVNSCRIIPKPFTLEQVTKAIAESIEAPFPERKRV